MSNLAVIYFCLKQHIAMQRARTLMSNSVIGVGCSTAIALPNPEGIRQPGRFFMEWGSGMIEAIQKKLKSYQDGATMVTYHWHRNQNEATQNYFRINYLQNYESESESEIRGEVSMWTWMRKIMCPININTKAKAKEYFRGINFTFFRVKGSSFSTVVLVVCKLDVEAEIVGRAGWRWPGSSGALQMQKSGFLFIFMHRKLCLRQQPLDPICSSANQWTESATKNYGNSSRQEGWMQRPPHLTRKDSPLSHQTQWHSQNCSLCSPSSCATPRLAHTQPSIFTCPLIVMGQMAWLIYRNTFRIKTSSMNFVVMLPWDCGVGFTCCLQTLMTSALQRSRPTLLEYILNIHPNEIIICNQVPPS